MALVRFNDLKNGHREGRSREPIGNMASKKSRPNGNWANLVSITALAGDDQNQPFSLSLRGEHKLGQRRARLR